MAPELSKLVGRVTFMLLALAAVAVEIAAKDLRPVGASLGLAAIWVAIAAGLSRFVPAPTDPLQTPPKWVFLLLVTLTAAPFIVEPLRRNWTGDGYPLELQMVCGLRNVGLGLAACAGWTLCLRLACVTSLFLILFSAAMSDHPGVMIVLGFYTAAGSFWLMLVYWSDLRSVFVSPERIVAVEVQTEAQRTPWLGLSVLVVLLSATIALIVVGPKRTVLALGELMPTSGGTGETDPFARSGVGDGPEETAGDDPLAAGMVESQKMIEDNKNSLIDAVSDMYGPPHKPRTDQERLVAAGKVDVIEFHGKLPDNRRPSRDFDTSRKGPKGGRKPESENARGLFEVQGRTPLHVRLVAYERYDAPVNRWIEGRKPVSRWIEPEGGDWMRAGPFKPGPWYSADERHRLKSADMKDNLVPTPAMLSRFRINKVDKPDYYEWDYDGVLALAGRNRTPPGVVVTTDCRTLEPARLPDTAFVRTGSGSGVAPELGEVPDAVRHSIERIAKDWVGNQPRGWPQIDAILTKLRTEYILDRDAAATPDHPTPVLWFLSESRRGPDYLFATATALALRTLDYPTRVCLGYYVSPAAYDPDTGHTPVRATDLHFWTEIRLQDGQWLVLEPSPSYEVLGPKLSLRKRIRQTLAAVQIWTRQYVGELVIAFVVTSVTWVRRRRLLDAIAVQIWLWRPGRTWREQVQRAVRVLERRGRWTGRPRSTQQTTCSWLCGVQPQSADRAPEFVRLAQMAEWAAYAPEASPPWAEAEVLAVCRQVLADWTLERWRKANLTSALGA